MIAGQTPSASDTHAEKRGEENTSLRHLRCVWVGPTSDGLSWLVHRIQHTQLLFPPLDRRALQLHQLSALEHNSLLHSIEQGLVDRLILACDTRLSYPRHIVETLQRSCPDVPMAVACGSWWDGFRRTGLGPVSHLALPWYRWWDGWAAWLAGDMREPLPPSAANSQTETHFPISGGRHQHEAIRSPSLAPPGCGLVVGNCRQTCETWRQVAQFVGYSVDILAWPTFRRRLPTTLEAEKYDWIVWDDSSLDTAIDRHEDAQNLSRVFEIIQSALPEAQWIATLSLPRADQWLAIADWDRCQLVVKPDSGHGLLRLLSHLRSSSQDSQVV